ncbi:hypothetical protein [Microbacterium sp. NIBRBAC000506063]|uniref:hypothetical protein n=1 Tax=Microbacterium sp. NIBRBAC000506063 TaxID=2734618 RepID=UPI001BB6D93C|nr:hypothetical protein [Microbacterium sp. NIBRBAC000506063]QTV79460.1 hypothetical protein KAE78_11190 [Microbacterium sp. NIBRBAC000506063]
MTEQRSPQLIPAYAVHCFFAGTCSHVVWDNDAHDANRRMQAHYDESHEADLARLGYAKQGTRS